MPLQNGARFNYSNLGLEKIEICNRQLLECANMTDISHNTMFNHLTKVTHLSQDKSKHA